MEKHLQYFRDGILEEIRNGVNSKAYDYMYAINKDHQDDIAISYFGTKISYKEMFDNIERCAKSLYAHNIREGDIISFVLPNVPEIIYLFYAANRIGAACNMIDPRTNASAIMERANLAKSKLVFVISDMADSKINEYAKQYCADKVVIITPATTLTKRKGLSAEALGVKAVYKIKNYKNNEKYITYHEFLESDSNMVHDSEYKKDTVAGIVYTSGTSAGVAKGVMISNEAMNYVPKQQMGGQSGFARQNTFLSCIPFFQAYGFMNGVHNSLCNGWIIQMIPKFNPQDFDLLIKKYKPNNSIGVPRFWELLVDNGRLDKTDLSFLVLPTIGGDKISPSSVKKINNFLEKHGSKVKVIIGYGASEFGGAVSVTLSDYSIYKEGSVGVFFPGCIAKVFDPDTGEEVKGDDRTGELYLHSPTMMLGYFNNDKETEAITYYDEDGLKYYRTGDKVHIDSDGINWIIDRYKRVIPRPDGHKVSASPIENVLMSHEYVSNCAVVGIPRDDKGGFIPTAFVQIPNEVKKKHTELFEALDALCSKEIPARDKPLAYIIIDKLPYTLIGKVDYRQLEETRFDEDTFFVDDPLFE